MRLERRLLVVKVAAVVVPLALIIAAMHFLLPGVARWQEEQLLGEGYEQQETEHLRLSLPRGTGLAARIAEDFERFTTALYADYGQALSLRPLDDKIKIRIFASHKDLVSYAGRKMKQDLSHAGGFYDPASWSIALTLRPQAQLFAMLCHEATHLLMDRSAALGPPRWSLWLAEGMAVFFEHSTVANQRVRLGGADRRDALVVSRLAAQGRHVPLRRLVRGGEALFHGEAGPLCYREAGLLVAYLLASPGGRHRDAFLRYYQLERQPGPCQPSALEAHLGISIEALEKEWLAYLQRVVR